MTFSIIGGLLCILGVILLVSANWQSIPREAKLGALLGLLTAATFLGTEGSRRRWHPAIPEISYLFAAVLPLVGLALVSQIFNLSGSGFNMPIYVTLRATGTVWEIGDVNEAPPTGDVPYLKGRAFGSQISYGIERYYVPEGKGQYVPGDLYAEIVIQPGGTAQLKKLYSDGKPWPR